jgi:hypothetical protein
MFRLLNGSFALLLACALSGATVGRADEPPAPKDDALDRLLEKLEKPDRPPADAKPDAEPPKTEGEKKPAGDTKEGEKKPTGELAPKDQALDSLLEKLGETRDKPDAPNDRRAPRGMPGEEKEGKDQAPAKPGEPKPQDLTGKSKDLDEHLEELTGRRRKKKDQDEEEGSGPLSKVIKEMREVEQRLGKPDTGEDTRKKQTEIVKNLEQLIEQLRNSSSQSRGLRIRIVRQAGQQPGQPQGGTTGANAGGVGPSKPAKPDGKHANVGDKDIWGHLPPELRQEMDNIAKEGMLPSKEELIRRYLLSVAKKSLTREE